MTIGGKTVRINWNGIGFLFKYMFVLVALIVSLFCSVSLMSSSTDWTAVEEYMNRAIYTVEQLPADKIVCNRTTTEDGLYDIYLLPGDANVDEELDTWIVLSQEKVTLSDGKVYRIVIQHAAGNTVSDYLHESLTKTSVFKLSSGARMFRVTYWLDIFLALGGFIFYKSLRSNGYIEPLLYKAEADNEPKEELVETSESATISATTDFDGYVGLLKDNIETVIELAKELPLELRESCKKSCALSIEIMKFVDENDYKTGSARKLNSYYFNEYIKFIRTYLTLDSCNTREAVEDALENTKNAIVSFEEVFNNILKEVLFNEVLDANVNADVFNQVAQSNGVLQQMSIM